VRTAVVTVEVRGETLAQVVSVTTANTRRLFGS